MHEIKEIAPKIQQQRKIRISNLLRVMLFLYIIHIYTHIYKRISPLYLPRGKLYLRDLDVPSKSIKYSNIEPKNTKRQRNVHIKVFRVEL